MDRNIQIEIKDRIAHLVGNSKIICGNNDYSVTFTFDDEWTGVDVKTLRVSYNNQYSDHVFTGNTVKLPPIIKAIEVYLGVFAGDITSTRVAVRAEPSILCAGGSVADPEPDVYNQIIELLNSREPSDGPGGADGASAYEIAVENGYIGTETEWLESLQGEKGDKGRYFIPSLSTDGYLSFEASEPNEAGQTEIITSNVSLKGAPGRPGLDGYIPIKGVDYFDGEPGKDGKDAEVDPTLSQPGAAADAAKTGEAINRLSEAMDELSASGPDALTEDQKASWRDRIGAFGFGAGAVSANLYDPSLQTPETIAPHYYVKGVPYSSTNYDTMWNCTAPIAVKPNTTYTIGLVPAFHYVYGSEDIMIEKPWSHAGTGVNFYDADGGYIKQTSANTFTTPENCASMRFNYIIGKGPIDLDELAARCMLVEGDTLPSVYEPFGTSDASDLSGVLSENGLSHYTWQNDILTVYQNGTKTMYGYSGNNNIMMCKGYGLTDAFVPFTTDILSPMIITASENADGDLDDSYRLTGGNHSYAQTSGAPSANTVLVEVFADGKPVGASGLFNTLTLHARHEVQAWNTEKADGTGRAVLIEDDYITWDGARMNVEIHLTPTEAVTISEYYGLQLAEINSCNIYGGKVKKNIASGGYSDEVPYFIEGICDGFRIRMHLDETGMGKYTYNTSAIKYSKNDYKKAYFRPIGESHSFTAEDCLWLRGYFEILPPVSVATD